MKKQLPLLLLLAPLTLAQDANSPGGPERGGTPFVAPAPASGASQELLISTAHGLIYRVDNYLTNPTAVLVGDPAIGALGDIAIDPSSGMILASVFHGGLYWVDPSDMSSTLIGFPTHISINALGVSPAGNYYGRGYADSSLWAVNTTTAELVTIGDTGHFSAGDLAYYEEGTLLGTTDTIQVDSINEATGAATNIGSSGTSNPYGIEVDEAGNVIVIGSQGAVYLFDPSNGSTSHIGDLDLGIDQVYGAAMSPGAGAGPPIGSDYCTPANTNSSGFSAVIAAYGSESAASNSVRLEATWLPTHQFGMFVNSMSTGFITPPGSQGNLCLSGQIGRHNQDILSSGADGTFSLLLDLTQTPTPLGPYSIQPGETWHFQAWFRDQNPAGTSNFTNGMTILFQ